MAYQGAFQVVDNPAAHGIHMGGGMVPHPYGDWGASLMAARSYGVSLAYGPNQVERLKVELQKQYVLQRKLEGLIIRTFGSKRSAYQKQLRKVLKAVKTLKAQIAAGGELPPEAPTHAEADMSAQIEAQGTSVTQESSISQANAARLMERARKAELARQASAAQQQSFIQSQLSAYPPPPRFGPASLIPTSSPMLPITQDAGSALRRRKSVKKKQAKKKAKESPATLTAEDMALLSSGPDWSKIALFGGIGLAVLLGGGLLYSNMKSSRGSRRAPARPTTSSQG